MRGFSTFSFLSLCLFGASAARAEPSVLVAASDPAQIAEVRIAKVASADSSLWLSVRLGGSAKLAVVAADASFEPATAADAWLRALDYATRVRVSPPLGPLAACTNTAGALADSGLPEPASLAPSAVTSATSELELRRGLEAAGISVDLTRLAELTAHVIGPYRFALYDAPKLGGATAAVRLNDAGSALAVPGIATAGRGSLPLTLFTLATTAMLPANASVSSPSELFVTYFGASASTDYATVRSAWLAENQAGWLIEARDSAALFSRTVIPGAGQNEPGLAHYFDAAPGQRDSHACFDAVQAARAGASKATADYGCDGADDLARSSSELDFQDIRLTRLFGSIGSAGAELRASDEGEQGSHVIATDFDAKYCTAPVTVSPGAGGSSVPGGSSDPQQGNASGLPGDYSSQATPTESDGESCDVTVFSDSCSGDSSSSSSPPASDSCSGNSSSSDSTASDSCSGNSSSSDSTASDSCSGNSSSSDSTASDSCSGNSSSDSSDESSGCGKSDYDGDTCSGSSANSAAGDSKTSSALRTAGAATRQHRPRRVRLSLLTLLSAALALPLRRRKLRRLLAGRAVLLG